MSEAETQTASQVEPGQLTSEIASEGVRARRAFMLKHFVPNADWINTNIVAKGKGTQAILGRVFGVSTGYEVKTNILPDGKQSESIVLKGTFQAESYLTGEISEATTVYLPLAYSEKVKTVFDMDPTIKIVELDCDVGLEATGKTIPYEWVVIAFREGQAMALLRRLRESRARPTNAVALSAPVSAPALAAPKPKA